MRSPEWKRGKGEMDREGEGREGERKRAEGKGKEDKGGEKDRFDLSHLTETQETRMSRVEETALPQWYIRVEH